MSQQGGITSGVPGTGVFPITPYTVGPIDEAAFQTVQAGLDAADGAGGGLVYVQPGTFTENLTLYDNIVLQGASTEDSIIIGTHTPPTSGTFTLDHLRLEDNNAIISSAIAGTTNIIIENCITDVTSGYTLDILNWTGILSIFNLRTIGAQDGGINNTGGSTGVVRFSELGFGTTNDLILSGFFVFEEVTVQCTFNPQTGATITANHCNFERIVEFDNNSIGFFYNCKFSASTACIDFNSTGELKLSSTVLDSSSPVALDGTGSGPVTINGVDFVEGAGVSASLTLVSGSTKGGNLSLVAGGNHVEMKGGGVLDFIGSATLVAGTVTVGNIDIVATDRILPIHEALNASSAVGVLQTTKSAGASFTINSLDSTGAVETSDVSTINYFIVRQI